MISSHRIIVCAILGTVLLSGFALPAEEINIFTKERIKNTDPLWSKYFSPEYVSEDEKTGEVTLNVVRKPGGAIGGGLKYFLTVEQKNASPFTVTVESRGEGINTKPGYNYCVTVAFYFQGGGHSGEKLLAFPGKSDGQWKKVEQTFQFERPVREIHICPLLCYTDGKAVYRILSIRTEKNSLKEESITKNN